MLALKSTIPAVVAALLFATPALAQPVAGDMSYGAANSVPAPTAMQPGTPGAAAYPAYGQQGYANPPSYVDCNNPYYAQYCQAYSAWLNQYYNNQYYSSYADDYGYPSYGYGDYGYGYPIGVGFGFFGRDHFHNGFFHHAGMFHGGFHGMGDSMAAAASTVVAASMAAAAMAEAAVTARREDRAQLGSNAA